MRGTRRSFLNHAAVSISAAAIPFDALQCRLLAAEKNLRSDGYGPLQATKDRTTGLNLLLLPPDFAYISFGWAGEPLRDGSPTPNLHDGMAVVAEDDQSCTIIRNHEIDDPAVSPWNQDECYDRFAAGGCTRLTFDKMRRSITPAELVLRGTVKNCAGGPTPWGSWLSCEETVVGPGDHVKGKPTPFEKPHGFVFEVPAVGQARHQPILPLGRFVHEAIAIDPNDGVLYLTEDQSDSAGFYRFIPKKPSALLEGGTFQMLSIPEKPDLRTDVPLDRPFDAKWVDIDDPLQAHSPKSNDGLGVYAQGKLRGGTTFTRLEGAWSGNNRIYFCATSGGNAGLGQVFEFNSAAQQLRLVFESNSTATLNYPDNITVSPRGGIILCEDSDAPRQRLMGLSPTGTIFPFAENAVVLDGQFHGHRGDFRDQEWCGATFSRDGQWLFVNLQTPGITFAITGPWERSLL